MSVTATVLPRLAQHRPALRAETGKREEIMFGVLRRTFEIPVDARQGQARVAQLEHDVRAREERGEHAREGEHVPGVP